MHSIFSNLAASIQCTLQRTLLTFAVFNIISLALGTIGILFKARTAFTVAFFFVAITFAAGAGETVIQFSSKIRNIKVITIY